MSSNLRVFEQVRRGELSSSEAADKLIEARTRSMKPSKPWWMPQAIYGAVIFVLAAVLPSLVHRGPG